jgi:hypothetical protein
VRWIVSPSKLTGGSGVKALSCSSGEAVVSGLLDSVQAILRGKGRVQ